MRKSVFVVLGLALALVAALAAVSPVDAGSGRGRGHHHKADGVFCYTPQLDRLGEVALDSEYDGPKTFVTTVEEAEWTGTFEGASRDYGVVGFRDAGVDAATFAATVVFDEVEVRGRTGAMELDFYGGRPDATADWEGGFFISHASGELEGVEGHGTWWGPGWLGDPSECGVIYYDVKRLRGLGRGH
jgi:hypothetical protein